MSSRERTGDASCREASSGARECSAGSRPVRLMLADASIRPEVLRFRKAVFEREQGISGLDDFDAEAVHLVACDERGIIATARIVSPEQRPFAMEQHFDLSAHFSSHTKVAEIGRYCVEGHWRSMPQAMFLHLGMLKLSLLYARSQTIESFVCSVQPHLYAFYRRTHFRQVGTSFAHPIFGHTTVMWLDLTKVWRVAGGRKHQLLVLLDSPRIPEVTFSG